MSDEKDRESKSSRTSGKNAKRSSDSVASSEGRERTATSASADESDIYRVAEPLSTDARVESVTIRYDDGRTIVFDERTGTYSRSRFQPNVLEFASKEEIIE